MNKEELLKAIEQKRQAIRPTDTGEMQTGTVPNNLEQGWLNALTWMERYINSLPAEHTSEDVEEAANIYANKQGLELKPFAIKFFKSGANWQKEQMMKGLCLETKVYQDEEVDGIDTPIESWLALENNEITNLPNIGLKDGGNVKVIIVKEDEPNIVNIEPPSFEESQGEVYNSYNVALNG